MNNSHLQRANSLRGALCMKGSGLHATIPLSRVPDARESAFSAADLQLSHVRYWNSPEGIAWRVERIFHDVLHIQTIDVRKVIPQVSGTGIGVQHKLQHAGKHQQPSTVSQSFAMLVSKLIPTGAALKLVGCRACLES